MTKDAPAAKDSRPDAETIRQEAEDREQWIKDHEYTGPKMTPEEYATVGRGESKAKRESKDSTPSA